MSRSRRATQAFALSLVVTASGIVVGLLVTPLLLRHLGDARVGAYRVAAEWLAYLALLDLGVIGTLQVAFARSLGSGDRAEVAASARAGFRAGWIMAGLSAAFGLVLVAAAPEMLRDMPPELGDELRVGLLVSLVAMFMCPLIAFRPLADAGQRGFVVQLALLVQVWLTGGIMIVCAVSGLGLAGQFLAVVIANAVGTLILVRDGLRRHPEILTHTVANAALPVAFSGAMFAFSLLSRIGLHSDAIIVGMTLGPTAVVAFAVTQRLLLLADAQVLALGAAAWPALAELHHQGRSEAFNHRLTQLTRWTGILVFALIVPLAAATRPFVVLWVGSERHGGDLLVLATAMYMWIHTIVAVWGWPLITTGGVRDVLPIYMIGIPLNVGVSIVGCYWLGVAGPAIGSAVSVALVWLPWLPMLLRRRFRTPLRPLASAVVGPVLLGMPLAAGLFLLSIAYPLEELDLPAWERWLLLAATCGAATLGYLAVAWRLVLPRDDRAELRARLLGR